MERKITVEFQTADRELDDLILLEFEKDPIQYANQFTTEGLISILLSATKESIRKVTVFFSKHRESFKAAFVSISPKIRLSLFDYAEKELLLVINAQ